MYLTLASTARIVVQEVGDIILVFMYLNLEII